METKHSVEEQVSLLFSIYNYCFPASSPSDKLQIITCQCHGIYTYVPARWSRPEIKIVQLELL
jgi:hypothetical protein